MCTVDEPDLIPVAGKVEQDDDDAVDDVCISSSRAAAQGSRYYPWCIL